jgi:hypothetical protein
LPRRKRLTIEIDNEIYQFLQQAADLKGTTPRSILHDFVQELVVRPIRATSNQEALWAWYHSISWRERDTYELKKTRESLSIDELWCHRAQPLV